jgi:hypothetical protein
MSSPTVGEVVRQALRRAWEAGYDANQGNDEWAGTSSYHACQDEDVARVAREGRLAEATCGALDAASVRKYVAALRWCPPPRWAGKPPPPREAAETARVVALAEAIDRLDQKLEAVERERVRVKRTLREVLLLLAAD